MKPVAQPMVRKLAKSGPRADAQRERILAAARQCFIDRGFHGASMALISDTAGMSPGLMYRYFASKNDIVLEIIRRQLESARLHIQQTRGAAEVTASLIEFLKQGCAGNPETMHAALFLETSAEGSRDTQIGAAVLAADRETRSDLRAWFAQRKPHKRAQLEARAVLLQCLFEGLMIRVVREPALDLDPLEPALHRLIEQLLNG
ncbi:MAG TPA: helix-turn-helix domain-containing protein [Burkholderiaceae bacterium]|jgi:AcrR family transcriptional regulator|nr:helix-turn-helix domain-containing protein [Burkholderiaceae bacterium]